MWHDVSQESVVDEAEAEVVEFKFDSKSLNSSCPAIQSSSLLLLTPNPTEYMQYNEKVIHYLDEYFVMESH